MSVKPCVFQSSVLRRLFLAAFPDVGYHVHTLRASAGSTCLCAQQDLRSRNQERVKRSLHLTQWLPFTRLPDPTILRATHAANQSKGRKLSWPADSPRALMAIYGKNHCQSPVKPQAGCCGHISELQQFQKSAKETHKGTGCLLISRGGGREGKRRVEARHLLGHSESQPLAVIKNSPRVHCEVPSARTLCSIVNRG